MHSLGMEKRESSVSPPSSEGDHNWFWKFAGFVGPEGGRDAAGGGADRHAGGESQVSVGTVPFVKIFSGERPSRGSLLQTPETGLCRICGILQQVSMLSGTVSQGRLSLHGHVS